jgi:hypothetical protein
MGKIKFLLLDDKKTRIEYKEFISNPNNLNIVKEYNLDLSLEEILKFRDYIISENYSFADNYTHLIIHESLFNENSNAIEELEKYIETTDKSLILFSGSINTYFYKVINKNIIRIRPKLMYANLAKYIMTTSVKSLAGDKYLG